MILRYLPRKSILNTVLYLGRIATYNNPRRVGPDVTMKGKFDETRAERISALLSSQDIPMQSFVVPRFQRNYAWRHDKEAGKLWEDIYDNYVEYKENIPENIIDGQYMLGPLVLLEDKKEEFEWQVIDGQQRLATLTTLFCVIRDIFFVLREHLINDEGYKISKSLIEKERFDEDNTEPKLEPKLQLNHTDRGFFFEMIQKEGDPVAKLSAWISKVKGQKKTVPTSHKLLMKCYEEFYDEVERALLTGFVDRNEAESRLKEREEKIEKDLTRDMAANPEKYGFPDGFFSRHWDGEKFVQDGKIDENERADYERIKAMPSGRRHQDANEYVRYIVSQKGKKFRKRLSAETKTRRSRMLRDDGPKNIGMLTKFLKHVIRQNFVVSVKVRNENDAFMIFETLNARNKPLSKSELIKNMCFKAVKNEKEIIDLDNQWMGIFSELENGDRFIRESLRSRYFDDHDNPNPKRKKKVKATTSNLFVIIKSIVNDDDEKAKDYINWLETDSKFVKFMDDPFSYTDDEVIKSNLVSLKRLDAIHIRIPLLTAYRRLNSEKRRYGFSEKDFMNFSSMLIKFHFRNRTIGKLHPSKMEDIMLDVAKKIEQGESLADITSLLRQKDIDDDEFESEFRKFKPDESEVIKYILLEIEKYLRNSQDVLQLKTDATVEHILPKDPGGNWNKGEFFNEGGDGAEHSFESYHNRIGNMTLLTKGLNSKIQNKSFCVKKTEAYKNEKTLHITLETVLKMAKCAEELGRSTRPEFNDVKEWTARIIDERSECFSKLARIIWSM